MTDADHVALLSALARKHLRVTRDNVHVAQHVYEDLVRDLEHVSAQARLFNLLRDRPNDPRLIEIFIEEIAFGPSPVERTNYALARTGISQAIEEAQSVTLAQLRRSAIPQDDIRFLRAAGFSDDDIEIFLATSIDHAHRIAASGESISERLETASKHFANAVDALRTTEGAAEPSQRKRKLFNGIGKILGGCVAGIGNALMAAGTIIAPNPATAFGAIASGGVAISGICAGIGDLSGE